MNYRDFLNAILPDHMRAKPVYTDGRIFPMRIEYHYGDGHDWIIREKGEKYIWNDTEGNEIMVAQDQETLIVRMWQLISTTHLNHGLHT